MKGTVKIHKKKIKEILFKLVTPNIYSATKINWNQQKHKMLFEKGPL